MLKKVNFIKFKTSITQLELRKAFSARTSWSNHNLLDLLNSYHKQFYTNIYIR